MIKIKSLQSVSLFFFVLISMSFFEIQTNELFFEYLKFVVLSLAFLLSIFKFKFKRVGLALPVALICVSIISSIFLAYYSWGQSFIHSIKASTDHLIWFVFFYLIHMNFKTSIIENVLLSLGFLYFVVSITQYFFLDVPLFGFYDEFDYSRGLKRNILNGTGLLFFSLFYLLNRTLIKNNFRNNFILASLFILLLLTATKQFFFATTVILIIHLFRIKTGKRTLIIFLLPTVLFLFLSYDNIFSNNVLLFEETDIITDNIRFLAMEFFLNDFSPNYLSSFFGNGVPWPDSYYGSYYFENVVKESYFYFDDTGLIGFYAMFGLLAVFGYLLIFYTIFTYTLPKQYYYLKYYLIFILLTSIGSYSVYHTDYLAVNVLVLYIYHQIHVRTKIKKIQTF